MTLVLAFFAPVRADQPSTGLRLVLRPVREGGAVSAVHVALTFPLGAPGKVAVDLPATYAGATRLQDNLVNVHVTSAQTTLRPAPEADRLIVEGPPGAPATVEYDLVQRSPGPPRYPDYFKPVVDARGFFITGPTALLRPRIGNGPFDVTVEWQDAQDDHVGSNFGLGAVAAHAVLSWAQFDNSIFFGGDFRSATVALAGGSVDVAIRGSWPFSDRALIDAVAAIVRSEQTFWRGAPSQHFLFTLFPTGDAAGDSGGTAFHDSFALYLPTGAALDDLVRTTIAHEYFHEWNPLRIAAADRSTDYGWFIEGFTDYYAYELALRNGVITPSYYFRRLNEGLRAYWTSPHRSASNAEVAAHAYERDYYDIPYRRGRYIAMRWNALIRNRSGGSRSIDDAVRSFAAPAGALPRLDDAWLEQHLHPWLGAATSAELRRFAFDGELAPPEPGLFGRCARYEPTAYTFDAGFDYITSGRSGILRSVVKNGPAYRAGLRNGDVFRRRGIQQDPDAPVVVTVYRREGGRTIRYLPRGTALRIPHFVIGSDEAFRRCYGLPHAAERPRTAAPRRLPTR